MTVAVSNRIRDLESVLHTTEQHSLTQLQEVALDIDSWETKASLAYLSSLLHSPLLLTAGAEDEGYLPCHEHVQSGRHSTLPHS